MGGLSKVAYTVRVSAYVGSILVSEPETSQQETERGSTSVITELGTTVRDEPRPACTFEPSTYSKWGGERRSEEECGEAAHFRSPCIIGSTGSPAGL